MMNEDLCDLESFVFRKMVDSKIPGLSLAVLRDGEIVYERSFGYRDLTSGKPATTETLYCIGSVTKSMTCLAMMQLQEKGLLNADDLVENYLPLKVRPMGEPIRIWHLMSHTSGIPALAYAEATLTRIIKGSDVWLPVADYKDLLTFLDRTEGWAHSRPGERWFYLNEGYIILGAIIEKVSGETYPDYVKNHILEPLEMKRSFFDKYEAEKNPNFATPYATTKEGDKVPSTYQHGDLLSDGGLISNVVDMANYVKMLLNKGEYKGRRLASEEAIIQMMKPRVKIPDELFTRDPLSYGYGFIIRPGFFGNTLFSHSGSVFVSMAYVGFVPEEHAGVIVLANSSGYPLSYIGEYALAMFLGEDPMKIPAINHEKILDELTGVYESYMGILKYSVTRRGGLLQIEVKDKYSEYTLPLIPHDVEGGIRRFSVVSLDRNIPVEFFEMNGERYMIYERYKMKRVG